VTARTESTRPAVAPQGSEQRERVGALALAALESVGRWHTDVTEASDANALERIECENRRNEVGEAIGSVRVHIQALIARCETAKAAVSEASERAASSERHAERLAEEKAIALKLYEDLGDKYRKLVADKGGLNTGGKWLQRPAGMDGPK